MIHPSYVELMEVVNDDVVIGEEPVVNSRYSIVSATAKRARQLVSGHEPLIDVTEGEKPLSIAVQELYEGKLKILTEDEIREKEAEKAQREAELKAQQEAEEEARRLAEEAMEAEDDDSSEEE